VPEVQSKGVLLRVRIEASTEGCVMTDKKRFRGNQFMIAKILNCADQANAAAVRSERQKLRDTIGRQGFERRSAAQAKRERKAAQRARQAGATQ
jgi:hypothetical protein